VFQIIPSELICIGKNFLEFKEIEEYEFVSFEYVSNYSMLYKINGVDQLLKPYLFAAHSDVVVVQEENWSHPPFEAKTVDSFIYGRGTLDCKSSLVAQLEAVRLFLRRFGRPYRTLYLAYGHDEEKLGSEGAAMIAKRIQDVEFEYILDEGMMVVEDSVDFVKKPLAYVGVAEKGFMTVKYFVETIGGHSSAPDKKNSAIPILSEAVLK
jgi:carboxypeptidase PM20D1